MLDFNFKNILSVEFFNRTGFSSYGKEPKPRYTSVNDLAMSLDLPENHETQISVVKQNHDFLKKV